MNKLLLDDGYYTFKEIAKKLKERDITVTYDKNTLHSKVETKLPLKLWRLGRLFEVHVKWCWMEKVDLGAEIVVEESMNLQVLHWPTPHGKC